MTATPAPTREDVLQRFGLRPADVNELARRIRTSLEEEVAVFVAEQDRAIPVVDYGTIAAGSVSAEDRAAIARRGCVVVRGTFERDEAEDWERRIGDYLATNRFAERFEARYGERAATGSGIIGIYWSRPQIEARQHAHMGTVRRFLNGFWRHASGGVTWFEPDLDIGYPDRLRRRAPGASARGLGPHIDAASCRGWTLGENLDVFRQVLAGHPDRYDPWDAAHRTTADPGSIAPSSAFRTFQGWTALSDMRPADGGLHIVPIPAAVSLSVVTGLLDDGDDTDQNTDGDAAGPFRAALDDLLAPALTPIPAVEPGDTVWWHGDLFHSVAPATNTDRWSNVMYIGAAPRCARNDQYAASMPARFEEGRSPVDFGDEDFEVDFAGRATIDDLNDVARARFGLDPLVHT